MLDPAQRDELIELRIREVSTSRGSETRRAARAATNAHMRVMAADGWSRAVIASLLGVREEEVWRRTGLTAGIAVGAAGPQPLAALVCEPCGRSWPSEEELLDHWVDDHEEMP